MAGKGDLRRPAAVPKAVVDAEYDRIFGKRADPEALFVKQTAGQLGRASVEWTQAVEPRGARERKARNIGQLELAIPPKKCMYPGCFEEAGHDMLHNRYELMREPKPW